MTASADSPPLEAVTPRRAALLGFPVSQSLTPGLYRRWIAENGLSASYTSMAVTPDALKTALHMLRDRGFAGCTLAPPHYAAALPLMDEHDESCLMSGGVNTVVVRDGRIVGMNNDGFGFLESLKAAAPGWSGARAVVLGTGMMARGVTATLKYAGAGRIVLAARQPARAEKIIERFTLPVAEVVAWNDLPAALSGATLLVNCTPLGQPGLPGPALDLSGLADGAVVVDAVYNAPDTALLRAARDRGYVAVDGLSVFLHRARLGFEHWFGVDPAVTSDIRAALAAEAPSADGSGA